MHRRFLTRKRQNRFPTKLTLSTDGIGLSWILEYPKKKRADKTVPVPTRDLPPLRQAIGIDPGRNSIATWAFGHFSSILSQ